jgi:hypothetical protein
MWTDSGRVAARRTLEWSEVGSEVVIIDRAAGELVRLNGLASFIWKRLDGTRTSGDLARSVCEQFAAEPDVAERDVRHFLGKLASLGLLDAEGSRDAGD